MKYKIEKNVPLLGMCEYPFKDMEVGDSFTVPISQAPHMRTTLNYQKPKLGMNFKTRTTGKEVRVWRVS